jgi:hypothetical protein
MVMVSAKDSPTTFCGPNGAGNFQLRGGGGSERFNLP